MRSWRMLEMKGRSPPRCWLTLSPRPKCLRAQASAVGGQSSSTARIVLFHLSSIPNLCLFYLVVFLSHLFSFIYLSTFFFIFIFFFCSFFHFSIFTFIVFALFFLLLCTCPAACQPCIFSYYISECERVGGPYETLSYSRFGAHLKTPRIRARGN